MTVHVCRPAVPACRLAENFTWDSLLSSLGLLSFRFKLARGPCSVDLQAAAARLAGRRSMGTELDEKGYTSVTSPAGWRPAGRPAGWISYWMGKCSAQCGACSACLEAEQALNRKAGIMADFLLMLDAWHMQLRISDWASEEV